MAAVAETVEVREKPIIFSGPMVKAILNGTKSQTRRVIKPQPRLAKDGNYDWLNKMGGWQGAVGPNGGQNSMVSSSPYKVGMRLWVRETWAIADIYDKDSGNQGQMPFELSYGTRGISIWYRAGGEKAYKFATRGRWRPSIFMPRAASRITLEITDVRVGQINRISLEDIEAEGTPEGLAQSQRNDGYARYLDFKVLWNSINEKRGFGWDKQPWVWVISFKRVKGPVLAESEGV
jgi:hypothetical protein